MNKPHISEVPQFFQNYFKQVPENNIPDAMRNAHAALLDVLDGLPDDTWTYAYAPGKWTIKQMIQHVLDTERIFAYRALCMGRGEQQPLPAFDENIYAAAAPAAHRTAGELLTELQTVSQSSLQLFHSFTKEALAKKGTAGTNEFNVSSLGFVMAGHVRHHIQVLTERYL